MKAIELQDAFGLENLALVDRPEPGPPGAGQVVLRMKAASINYRDWLTVTGVYNPKQPLPLVPASDGVGEVIATGTDVTRVQVGDRVTPIFAQGWLAGMPARQTRHQTLGGPLNGTLTEQMCLHEDGVVHVPGYLSDVEAATLPCAAVTAWNAVIHQGGVRPGQTVVIQGTGGVALFAFQFAKLAGARVIITSKSDEKLERCASMGADHGLNYRATPAWGHEVRALTDGGADLVIELGGGDTLEQSIRAVRPGGQISLIGVLAGPVAKLLLPLVVMQNIRLQGIMVGSRAVHQEMMAALAQHEVQPVVDSVFPLEQSREAFAYLDSGRHFGKICIRHEA